jgi:hypothetical protein
MSISLEKEAELEIVSDLSATALDELVFDGVAC